MPGLGESLRGRPRDAVDSDPLPAERALARAAVLDTPARSVDPHSALPPLWHWVFFQEWPPHGELGVLSGHVGDSPPGQR